VEVVVMAVQILLERVELAEEELERVLQQL
jgi:hypothetical protein